MDQRHEEYVAYYAARLRKAEGRPLHRRTEAAERALYEAIAGAPDLEAFREIEREQQLTLRCAIARVIDVESAQASLFRELGEDVRAAAHEEVLQRIEAEPPATVEDLNTLVTEIHTRWSQRIAADELLRETFWYDLRVIEDLESHLYARVPEDWRPEAAERFEEERARGRAHYRTHVLPEAHKFIPDWAPDHDALREPRHRHHLPIPDDAFESRLAWHRRYWGI